MSQDLLMVKDLFLLVAKTYYGKVSEFGKKTE